MAASHAKLFNERVRLAATYLNTLAVAVLAGAVVIPLSNAAIESGWLHWIWIPVSAILHLAGQGVLSLFLKPET